MRESHASDNDKGKAEADAFEHGTYTKPGPDEPISIWSIPQRTQTVFISTFLIFSCYSSYIVYLETALSARTYLSFLDSIIKVGHSSIMAAFAFVIVVELFRICYLKSKQNIEARRLQREKEIIAKHYQQIGQKNPLDSGG